MKQPFLALCLLSLVGGPACVRASFPDLQVKDSGSPDHLGDHPVDVGKAPADARICLAPIMSCTSPPESGDVCNPVCQTASCDWCTQKCTVGGDGKVACASMGVVAARAEGCTISNPGELTQYDDCAPGTICLSPEQGSKLSYCFPICSSSSDCVGRSTCSPRLVSPVANGSTAMALVCDPVPDSCNPSSSPPCCNPILQTGCPDGQYCYLASPDVTDSRTVCDYTAGFLAPSATCASSHECALGYGCNSLGVCKKACDATHACPNNGTCSLAGIQFGYCP